MPNDSHQRTFSARTPRLISRYTHDTDTDSSAARRQCRYILPDTSTYESDSKLRSGGGSLQTSIGGSFLTSAEGPLPSSLKFLPDSAKLHQNCGSSSMPLVAYPQKKRFGDEFCPNGRPLFRSSSSLDQNKQWRPVGTSVNPWRQGRTDLRNLRHIPRSFRNSLRR